MLQDDELGMEAKGMHWIAITWDLGFEVHWRTLQNTMREACGYGKHKAALIEYLLPCTKKARNKWAHDLHEAIAVAQNTVSGRISRWSWT